MRHTLEDVQDGANLAREHKDPDALMEHKRAMLRKILKAKMHERLSATRPVEQVGRRGRLTLRVTPQCGFERGKRFAAWGCCTVDCPKSRLGKCENTSAVSKNGSGIASAEIVGCMEAG